MRISLLILVTLALASCTIKPVETVYHEDEDIDIRLIMPKYGFISERKYILREVIRLAN